jgi:hypothetical protein
MVDFLLTWLISYHKQYGNIQYLEIIMATFFDANQVRLMVKMKLSNYSWYHDCCVVSNDNDSGYMVLVGIKRLDDKITKIIPKKVNGVIIKHKLARHAP